MERSARLWTVALILAAGAALLARRIGRSFAYPYPPFNQLVYDTGEAFAGRISLARPLASEGGFRDLAGPLFGLRRLTADIAWISVLQYYGAHEAEEDENPSADSVDNGYPALKKMVLRVIRLDPSLHYAALYGAGALAFSLNRPDEGLDILREAIGRDPTYWRFRLYVGAILYKQQGRSDRMIPLLEDAIRYPDCPTMVKSILANIYQERGENAKALEVWIGVLEDRKTDDWYRHQAGIQIAELRKKLGL